MADPIVRGKPQFEPWNITAGDLRQQCVIQTATVASADTRGRPSLVWPWDATAATWATGTATITTAQAHGLSVGQAVTLSGFTPAAWNGSYVVKSIVSATAFTVAIASNPQTVQVRGIVVNDPAIGTLVRCKIDTQQARKTEIARQLVPTATHVVTMRYRPFDVDLQRIVFKSGRVLNVASAIDVQERHVRLELVCTEQET